MSAHRFPSLLANLHAQCAASSTSLLGARLSSTHLATSPVLLLLAILAAPPAAAQIYKWVDEKGVTHYSESPPGAAKAGAKKMEVPVTPGTPGSAPATKSNSELEVEFRQRQVQRDQQERATQEQRERQQAACPDAQRQLARLKEQIALYRRDDKGERVYLADSERQAETARVQAFVDRYCSY